MSTDRSEHIRALVDRAPPLTASQRDRLRTLLGSAQPATNQSQPPVTQQQGGDRAA